MDWRTVITITHIIGTVLGVGGATFAEVFYRKALKDGAVDETEGSFLGTTYRVLRIGMVLLVLSGFGYLLLTRLSGRTEHLYDPRLWMKLTMTVVILVNALLMALRKIPPWFGAAISIVSWYGALVLGIWRKLDASFFTILLWYAVVVAIAAFIFRAWKTGERSP